MLTDLLTEVDPLRGEGDGVREDDPNHGEELDAVEDLDGGALPRLLLVLHHSAIAINYVMDITVWPLDGKDLSHVGANAEGEQQLPGGGVWLNTLVDLLLGLTAQTAASFQHF